MQIKRIHLSNFRNFKEKSFVFSNKTSVIVGPNASGKTNVLESLFLLSTGKSFRAKVEEEVIFYEEEIARAEGAVIEKEKGEKFGTNLEVILTRGEITIGMNPRKVEKVARKRLLINGVGKRLIDFAGKFRVTLFGPWDLGLVTEFPGKRRDFLDMVLSQTDREYRRTSLSYVKGLRQRNRLLLKIKEEGVSRSQLLFWDKLLIKNGDYISGKRAEFIEFANSQEGLNNQKFSLEYDKSAISEARLEQYKYEEVAATATLVGPHRDDFIFRLEEKESKKAMDIARYGSRGEQRMVVLWLKLAELSFIKEKIGELPTLLLDDIFSELDHEHRKIVMEVTKKQQTIITTADPHFVEGLDRMERIVLSA
ncbi:hypothetical protein A2686_01230 [Candidatus Woesebacteria bacterium RIFCSPHIGHO2_01_FULL_38_10]|uniref:DNA replication and repair protein RecF n=1 Tax=Candidatus Woesebacteria bacterium RIFCSPLOWO2_01_FULL_39_10b TaxID=1802517 RepID=A0A1F8B7E7_9BACT|nr:MAG: hypothetical protein A2686_01230 [Candidatus Woesebacteria bacterium RIFCSPHIGHO2_01_FULL_38_10]OGM59976.1 MAG: hypothetical protein A2892_03700 [Candidatus Woesebacteria bacterium RIFCSPLOWO2_01_FULL_39_10b]